MIRWALFSIDSNADANANERRFPWWNPIKLNSSNTLTKIRREKQRRTNKTIIDWLNMKKRRIDCYLFISFECFVVSRMIRILFQNFKRFFIVWRKKKNESGIFVIMIYVMRIKSKFCTSNSCDLHQKSSRMYSFWCLCDR